MITAHGGRVTAEAVHPVQQEPEQQPAQRFTLADLTQYWNPEWRLERAGFGAHGGLIRTRGSTYLDGDVLATYPRDEVRGLVLRRTLIPRENAVLRFEAGVDAGRAWELAVCVNDRQIVKRVIDGLGANATKWETVEVDLREFAGRETELRLYQLVLVRNRTAGNAYWKALRVE